MHGPAPLNTELLILQPTPFCNIDCNYCYLPNRNDRRKMSFATLEAVFSSVLPSPLAQGRLTVVWHAGEPLVLPPSWYDAAFSIAERHRPADLILEYNFQTNGTLIDTSWIEFFQRTGAKVGLSIDGPAEVHDRHRRKRNGAGTHAATMRGLRLLQDAGYRPHVITVLTLDALDDPDALFEFYLDAGISDVSLNVEEIEAAHGSSSLSSSGADQKFRSFLTRFLGRMRESPGRLALRELRTAAAIIHAGGLPEGANQESEPLRIMSVAVDGRVGSFSPELLGVPNKVYGDFTFGNIADEKLETIVCRIVESDLHRDICAGVAACQRECAWFDLCRGGSPGNKLFEAGRFDTSETMYCRLTRKTVFDVVLEVLETTTGLPVGRRQT